MSYMAGHFFVLINLEVGCFRNFEITAMNYSTKSNKGIDKTSFGVIYDF